MEPPFFMALPPPSLTSPLFRLSHLATQMVTSGGKGLRNGVRCERRAKST